MKFVKLGQAANEEEIDDGSWAVSYGDMVTLLLSFFVIFFTTDFDKKKQQQLNEHMMQDLAPVEFGDFKEGKKREETFAGASTGVAGQAADSTASLKSAAGLLDQKGGEKGEGYKIEVIPWGQSLIVKFSHISFFKSGEVEMTKEGGQALQEFSNRYLPYAGTYRLSVKGFTDRKKVLQIENRKRFKDNLELSALRAVSAMRVLQKSGIPLSRIDIAGHGEMNKAQKYLKDHDKLTQQERDALSRTIVMIIKPEKEENFL